MKLKIVTLIVLSCLSLIGYGQTYSFAGYVQHGQSFFDAAARVHARTIKGNLSVSGDLLAGMNVTSPKGDAGGMIDLNYDAGKGWIVFAGPVYTQNIDSFSVKSFSWNNVTLAVGVRSPINWAMIFSSGSSLSVTSSKKTSELPYHAL